MNRMKVSMLLAAALSCAPSLGHAAPSPGELCTAAVDKASAGYAKCRLDNESKAATGKLVDAALVDALAKCSLKFVDAFDKAVEKYGAGDCPPATSSDFEAYLTQCSDDVAAAAEGEELPDYVGELIAVQAELAACEAALPTPTPEPTPTPTPTPEPTPTPAPRYVDNGNGTVTDSTTSLVWEKLSDDGSIHDQDNTYNWANATAVKVAALNSAVFAGYSDWRVPTIEELQSIVNLAYGNPTVSPVFNTSCAPGCTVLNCSCTVSSVYWSSSTHASTPADAWIVFFYDGHTFALTKTDNYYVRAVRGGS